MSHSLNQHHRALINYLPGGRLYSSALRSGSNLYNFLLGLSEELKRTSDVTEGFRNNILPDAKPRSIIVSISTNLIESPRDLTEWPQIGTAVSAYDAIGIDNVTGSASTLTDDNSIGFENVQDTITIPDDSNLVTFSAFVKKNVSPTANIALQLILTGGTVQRGLIHFDPSDGSFAAQISIGTVNFSTIDIGDFWQFIVTVENNSSGNIIADVSLYPAIGTVLGTSDSNAVGSAIFDYALLELNTSTPSNVFDEAIGTGYDFVEEWENALAIPDDCFPGAATTSLEIRRNHILAKLAALGVQSEQDFIDLAAIFGISATIAQIGKFTIEITTEVVEILAFPLVFPISFSVSQTGVYQCLVTKLKPANCDIVFVTI